MTPAHLFAALHHSLVLLESKHAEKRCVVTWHSVVNAEQCAPLSRISADYVRWLLVPFPKGPRNRGRNKRKNRMSDRTRAAAWRNVDSAYSHSPPCAERTCRITTRPFTRGSKRAINYLKKAEA